MNLQSIVADLKRQRDRLSRAIAELENADASPAADKTSAASSNMDGANHRGRGLTPAGRRRLSEAMKKRWAERRKKKS